MPDFKTGDVVKLLPHGPRMTVENPNLDGQIFCQWFDGDQLLRCTFDAEMLQKEQE